MMADMLPITVDARSEYEKYTNTRVLLDALRNHYLKPNEDWPGGVLLTEVQSPATLRRADAVYLGFTSSRGYCIDVCELKVSKADFRRELDDPSKAEAWWPHSTRWWIVSPDPSITPPEELPDGWGLMCPSPRGRRFKVVKQPAIRKPHVDLSLLITLAKKMDNVRQAEVTSAVTRAVQDADRAHYESTAELRRKAHAADPAVHQRLQVLDQLEAISGIEVRDYAFGGSDTAKPEQFGEALRRAVKAVQAEQEADRHARQVQSLIDAARGHLDRLEKAAKAMRSHPTTDQEATA